MGLSAGYAAMIAEAVARGTMTPVGGGAAVNLPAAAPALDSSEADFQLDVIRLAQANGWRVAHFRTVEVVRGDTTFWTTPADADGVGIPDLELVRDVLLKAELKSRTGTLKEHQKKWRDAYKRAGVEWHCWRPANWPAIVERLTRKV